MNDLEQRLRQLVQISDPDGTVTVRWLAGLVGEEIDGERDPVGDDEPLKDLSVADVAEIVGRSESTVRGWLAAGELRGYKLNGRDWRVTREGLREYRDAQRRQDGRLPAGDVDIGEWRNIQ